MDYEEFFTPGGQVMAMGISALIMFALIFCIELFKNQRRASEDIGSPILWISAITMIYIILNCISFRYIGNNAYIIMLVLLAATFVKFMWELCRIESCRYHSIFKK